MATVPSPDSSWTPTHPRTSAHASVILEEGTAFTLRVNLGRRRFLGHPMVTPQVKTRNLPLYSPGQTPIHEEWGLSVR